MTLFQGSNDIIKADNENLSKVNLFLTGPSQILPSYSADLQTISARLWEFTVPASMDTVKLLISQKDE